MVWVRPFTVLCVNWYKSVLYTTIGLLLFPLSRWQWLKVVLWHQQSARELSHPFHGYSGHWCYSTTHLLVGALPQAAHCHCPPATVSTSKPAGCCCCVAGLASLRWTKDFPQSLGGGWAGCSVLGQAKGQLCMYTVWLLPHCWCGTPTYWSETTTHYQELSKVLATTKVAMPGKKKRVKWGVVESLIKTTWHQGV